jgi:TRAP-type transport system small permease protein
MSDAGLPDEPAHEAPPAPRGAEGLIGRAAFLIGSLGLILALVTDTLAVIGRHTGFTLLGSIEIVQACVVLVAATAMIGTTIQMAHASVHIILDHVSPRVADRLQRFSNLIGAIVFFWLAAGSAWVLADLWSGVEITELLGLPLRPLRLLWLGSALLIAILFLWHAVRRRMQK